MTTRKDLDIRIAAGLDCGFVIWEAGNVIAGLGTREEVAMWIERRLRDVAGELPRPPEEPMPDVIRREQSRRGGILKVFTGNGDG